MSSFSPSIDALPGLNRHYLGDGLQPSLQAGTLGWQAEDLENPVVRKLWEEGRFEILEGVLTEMPPAYFAGGEASQNLIFLLRDYCRANHLKAYFSTEVEIRLNPTRVLRADAAVVFGEDLRKFDAFTGDGKKSDWRKRALTLPPTLVIESISQGHELHDRETKKHWYAEFGIQHYWIVDVFARRLDCLVLREKNYADDGHGQDDQLVAVESLPGLKFSLNDIWGA